MSRVPWQFLGTLCVAAAACLPAYAQYPGHVEMTQQQNATHLRATGILEYTGDLKSLKLSRLIPIAVWDGTTYQPGGLYLAQPAPLAVLSGTQYILESSGHAQGFFNIGQAESLGGHWIGVGRYVAPPVAKLRPKTSTHMPYQVKDYDPDKPHFAHRPADEAKPSGGNTTAQAEPQVDPDRPTLHERPKDGSDSGSPLPPGHPDVDPDRPKMHRQPEAGSAGAAPVVGATATQQDDPNRPHLQYVAPTEQLKLDKPDALAGQPADMKQMVAISDTRPPGTESWLFTWSDPDDAVKMKTALEAIAEKAVAPAPAAVPAPKKHSPRHNRLPEAPKAPVLTNEDFRCFNLSFGGGATMVFSAQTADAPTKYVTIIAQPDFYGQPQVLLQQVTSENQMDVTPRMRVVDAADTQGVGRADLIFELQGRNWREFAIYRIAGGSATQAFVTQPTGF